MGSSKKGRLFRVILCRGETPRTLTPTKTSLWTQGSPGRGHIHGWEGIPLLMQFWKRVLDSSKAPPHNFSRSRENKSWNLMGCSAIQWCRDFCMPVSLGPSLWSQGGNSTSRCQAESQGEGRGVGNHGPFIRKGEVLPEMWLFHSCRLELVWGQGRSTN